MAEKVYAPIKVETKTGQFGEFHPISFRADKMIEFINANKNEAGYVNLTMQSRKEVGKYGESHSVVLNDWKPTSQTANKPF